mmetsp:Transcript_4190/g.15803  ORF Transcript_4190/g.15803 Transcript_4190/m.15803 type:complete len:701 (-) Transcript_4190:1811-3913(-)
MTHCSCPPSHRIAKRLFSSSPPLNPFAPNFVSQFLNNSTKNINRPAEHDDSSAGAEISTGRFIGAQPKLFVKGGSAALQNASSPHTNSRFSIQNNNDFHHNYTSKQLFRSFGMESMIRRNGGNHTRGRKWRQILDFRESEPSAGKNTNSTSRSPSASTAASKEWDISMVPNMLIQEEGYQAFVDSYRERDREDTLPPSRSTHASSHVSRDRKHILEHIDRLSSYVDRMAREKFEYRSNHPFHKTHLDVMKISAVDPNTSQPYEEISTLHLRNQCPPQFLPYKYVDNPKDFDKIVSKVWASEGFEKAKDLVLALPLINDAFRNESTLAVLVFNVFFRSKELTEMWRKENLTWVKYAVTFRHILEHLPSQSDLSKIHEMMLFVWLRVNMCWHELGSMRKKLYKTESSSAVGEDSDAHLYSPIDLMTERFLYVYSNSRLSPSLRSISLLAQSYCQIGHTRKYDQLVKWINQNGIEVSAEWKHHFLSECYVSEGAYHRVTQKKYTAHERTILIKALARGGKLRDALKELLAHFPVSSELRTACQRYLDDGEEYSAHSSEQVDAPDLDSESLGSRKMVKSRSTMILKLIEASEDIDLALALRNELTRIWKCDSLSQIPASILSEVSTMILRKYIENYDIDNGTAFFRQTFSPLSNTDSSPVENDGTGAQPSIVTFEWMKRGAILTANGRWLKELERDQEQLRHVL